MGVEGVASEETRGEGTLCRSVKKEKKRQERGKFFLMLLEGDSGAEWR